MTIAISWEYNYSRAISIFWYNTRVIYYKEHTKSVVISQLALLFPIGITNPKVHYLPNYHNKLWTQQYGNQKWYFELTKYLKGILGLLVFLLIIYAKSHCNDSHYITYKSAWISFSWKKIHINTWTSKQIYGTLVKISVLKHPVHIPNSYYLLLK